MKNHFSVVVYGVAIIVVFCLSLHIFASNPSNCGYTARSWARNYCNTHCEDRGLWCLDAVRTYGACLGGYSEPTCYSIWTCRCSDNKLYGCIHIMTYDPLCY